MAKGSVIAAKVGRMSGAAGFHHLLLWGEAAMSLRFESPTGERRIAATVDQLLDGGARFAAEFEQLAARVGGPQAVFAHEPRRAAEARAQIPAEVMVLVKQYDGQKPLIDIIEDSPFKPFDTIKITFRLAELGAIARRETRETTPLSERLAVRDWLLGAGDEQRDRPPAHAAPGGLTEAGRRAAEAYAAQAARRAAAPSPSDDILDDSAALRAAAAKVTRARSAAKKGAAAKKETPRKEAAREPAAARKDASPKKDAVAKKDVGGRGAATGKKDPVAGKLSAQAAAHAVTKEPVFDPFEEEFFARDTDHLRPSTVENFDDLEPNDPRRKLSGRRDWFGFKKKQ